jgi:hypothetical protein
LPNSRCRLVWIFGFKASGKGGYHGYKWKHLTERLALSVWTAQGENGTVGIREMETVEAEIAFLCRLESDQWPAFQHEIHFYTSTEAHRVAAKTIYHHAIRTVSWTRPATCARPLIVSSAARLAGGSWTVSSTGADCANGRNLSIIAAIDWPSGARPFA